MVNTIQSIIETLKALPSKHRHPVYNRDTTMPNLTKPYKGLIENWRKVKWPNLDGSDGYFISGRFINHPDLAGKTGHTSMIVNEIAIPEGFTIETENSYYTLIGEELK